MNLADMIREHEENKGKPMPKQEREPKPTKRARELDEAIRGAIEADRKERERRNRRLSAAVELARSDVNTVLARYTKHSHTLPYLNIYGARVTAWLWQ